MSLEHFPSKEIKAVYNSYRSLKEVINRAEELATCSMIIELSIACHIALRLIIICTGKLLLEKVDR